MTRIVQLGAQTPMTTEPATMGHFEPLHAAHAIEQVQIAINLEQPLDEPTFEDVRQALKVFDNELPGKVELRNLSFTLGQAPLLVANSANQFVPRGFAKQRSAPNGVIESELRIESTTIAFRTTRYSRWDAVWKQFGAYLATIIDIFISKSRVMQVSLSSVDKFVWTGAPADCRPKFILRPNSQYLCPYVYDSPDLWHSHTGAFLSVDRQTKRLLNINVDHLDEEINGEQRRIISIATVLTDMFNQPGYDTWELAPGEAFDRLEAQLSILHQKSKRYFGEVITDDMCKRIALSWEK